MYWQIKSEIQIYVKLLKVTLLFSKYFACMNYDSFHMQNFEIKSSILRLPLYNFYSSHTEICVVITLIKYLPLDGLLEPNECYLYMASISKI